MAWWNALAESDAGRSAERELLDADDLDPGELRTNLREMAMLNRLPGGVDASVEAVLCTLDGSGDPTVIDAGAGLGDFARRIAGRAPVRVVVSDIRDEILGLARRNLRGTDSVTFLRADVRDLPLADEAVDVAHASLLLHHLDPPDAVAALGELRRVARRGVVVNDLRRGRLANAITTLTVLALARGRYTRHDGPLSARRAYTLGELDDLASAAGLRLLRRSPAWLPRVTSVYR
jgi:SAM-dependent methyltransferase